MIAERHAGRGAETPCGRRFQCIAGMSCLFEPTGRPTSRGPSAPLLLLDFRPKPRKQKPEAAQRQSERKFAAMRRRSQQSAVASGVSRTASNRCDESTSSAACSSSGSCTRSSGNNGSKVATVVMLPCRVSCRVRCRQVWPLMSLIYMDFPSNHVGFDVVFPSPAADPDHAHVDPAPPRYVRRNARNVSRRCYVTILHLCSDPFPTRGTPLLENSFKFKATAPSARVPPPVVT